MNKYSHNHVPGQYDWSDRQNRALIAMWSSPGEYPMEMLTERFQRSPPAILNQAAKLGLADRPARVTYAQEPREHTKQEYREIVRQRQNDVHRRKKIKQPDPITVIKVNGHSSIKVLDQATRDLIDAALAVRDRKVIRFRLTPEARTRLKQVKRKK